MLENLLSSGNKKSGTNYRKLNPTNASGNQSWISGVLVDDNLYTFALWTNSVPAMHQRLNLKTLEWKMLPESQPSVYNATEHVLTYAGGKLRLLFGKAGGQDRGDQFESVPGSAVWTSGVTQVSGASQASVTTINDDVFVVGSVPSPWHIKHWVHATQSWKTYNIASNQPGYGNNSSSASVDNLLYIAGGTNVPGKFASFDPMTNTWNNLPNPPKQIFHASNMTAIGKRLFVFGGYSTPNVASNILLEYNIDLGVWIEHEPAPASMLPRTKGVLIAFEGKLYLYAGQAGTGTWLMDLWEITV